MKELSIKEKAKAYDEIIKKATKMHNENCEACKACIEELIPELKESENERIRKGIISYLALYKDAIGEDYKSWIAWLEKQGKNNIGISEAIKQKLEDNLNMTLEKETQESWNEFLDKQGEQKPAEWSEEDETYLDHIITAVKLYYTDDTGKENPWRNELLRWLKSLKDRVQPKQEWSKKDIDMIDYLIRCCEKEHKELCNDKYGHQDIISDLKRDCRKKWDWFESLKNKVVPQLQWKPSKEQIMALRWVLNHISYDSHKEEISGLLDQLNKLMEK